MDHQKGPGGRPSKYEAAFADQARAACEMGARDVDLAEMFDVSLRTISSWKVTQPAFSDALKTAKAVADAAVERSLFQRATGYSHDAVKFHIANGEVITTPYVEHYPPDTTAAIFWLKNRKPAEWRDKHEVSTDITVKSDFDASRLTKDERADLRVLLLKGGMPETKAGSEASRSDFAT